MKARLRKLLRRGVAAWLLTLVASTTADAALIEIRMDGADFNYVEADGKFCDSGGGIGCSGDLDDLTSLSIYVDGLLQQTLNADVQIGVNLRLSMPGSAGPDPIVNDTTNIVSVNDDNFDARIAGAPGVLTDVDTGSITFSSAGQVASGTGTSSLVTASLPFGLIPVNPISWSFMGVGSCLDGNCTYSGSAILSWGERSPTPVPEPSSMILFGTGAAVAALVRRRRGVRLNHKSP